MELDSIQPDILWRYYQRGYMTLVRSGLYFRQVLRPALSHVYFKRAVPLLVEYARANHTDGDLPPGFGDQMEACPLTPRDLLHLDYAICLGYTELRAEEKGSVAHLPVLEWPGPGGSNGIFIAADATIHHPDFDTDFDSDIDDDHFNDDGRDNDEGGNGSPPYDL